MRLRENASAVPAPSEMSAQAIDEALLQRLSHFLTEFAPFEKNAILAIAFSGGGDSMALLHLASQWATTQDIQLVALTVDHGLRPESGVEAQDVGAWASCLGVQHRVLRWAGNKPTSGIMSAARDARYRLMDEWCGENAVLHLLAGHTQDDQAETYLMRKRHASGASGLAGMSQVLEFRHSRMLRPLLTTNRSELRDYLSFVGGNWIDDPSNENPVYERVQTREYIASQSVSVRKLSDEATQFGQQRVDLNARRAACIARSVSLNSFGGAIIDLSSLRKAPPEMLTSVLARVLTVVGGRAYEPSPAKINALVVRLLKPDPSGQAAASLGGCQLYLRGDRLQVLREGRNLPAAIPVAPHQKVYWDNRFVIEVGPGISLATGKAYLRPLCSKDWIVIKSMCDVSVLGRRALNTCESLPVIVDDLGLFAVPHLGCFSKDSDFMRKNAGDIVSFLSFCPLNSLSGNGFSVA